LNHPKLTWHQFRDKFVEMGGDGIYSAWKLSYQEPLLQDSSNLGWRNRLISKKRLLSYRQKGLCPVAENYQPKLLAFKTDYWDENEGYKQAEILKKLIKLY
jgi:perosamine synthetase